MTVLVATDFSDHAEKAFRVGERLARSMGTNLRVAHALEAAADGSPWADFIDVPEEEIDERYRQPAEERLREWIDDVGGESEEEDDAAVDTEIVLKHAVEGILEAADREDVDLLVLGATGRGPVENAVLGSTTEEVVRRADVPVLIVSGDDHEGPYERIVAPVDFSYCSRRSLGVAEAWARREGAALEVVHAHGEPGAAATILQSQIVPKQVESFEQQRKQRFESVVETLDLEGLEVRRHFEAGRAHDVIADVVDDTGADLVVMGSQGARGLERFFLGSTATKVLRRMPASVLVVRTPEEGSAD